MTKPAKSDSIELVRAIADILGATGDEKRAAELLDGCRPAKPKRMVVESCDECPCSSRELDEDGEPDWYCDVTEKLLSLSNMGGAVPNWCPIKAGLLIEVRK